MFKFIFLISLIVSNSFSADFAVISFINDDVFNYFASLIFWLLIISSPMFLVISLVKYVQRAFTR